MAGVALTSSSLQGPSVQARLGRYLWISVLFLPTLLSILYFGFIAADRYVSEAQFVVRNASKQQGISGLSAMLQLSGLGRAQDETYSVQAFLNSRAASDRLAEHLPIADIYSHPNADFLMRYPSLIYGSTSEERRLYLNWMISTSYSSSTGISTLRVTAFEPSDAQKIAKLLLDFGEETVNKMNVRVQTDAAATAEREVKLFEDRLINAQIGLTAFRNRELMIDPASSSLIATELIGRLGAELSLTEAQIIQINATSPNSPQLAALQAKANSLKSQVAAERSRIASSSTGLADKLAQYERLVLDQEFAKQSLSKAVAALDAAQQEARRQQLYLDRVVEPSLPDYAAMPQRARLIVTTLAFNILLLLLGWLITSGFREHAAEGR